MTLKNKIGFIISLLFTFIFALSAFVIFMLFSKFRKDEFENRLREQALSSVKLLVEVEQVDRQLLKIIDQNSINKLYDEKTLIFDTDYKLIYSSLDDTKIKWSIDDLKYLKTHKTFFRKEKENEVYGFFYDSNEKDYYALISANDSYGKRKLEFLAYILLTTYVVFTIFIWLFLYRIVKKLLLPIDTFHKKIKNVTENNLNIRIDIKSEKDEIDLLAEEFNQMLERINHSYQKQQEFTANASHELRTPISRIMARLENEISKETQVNGVNEFNKLLLEDINQLSELTNSLLLLSKLDVEILKQNEVCRIDEVIFDAADKINQNYPDFKMELSFKDVETLDIKGNKSLLYIAFANLFKNAYLYSDNQQARVVIGAFQNKLEIAIANNGKTISEEEQKKLFDPFMRGNNAKNKSGLGLGLRIVKRILNQQNSEIHYRISPENENEFIISFNAM